MDPIIKQTIDGFLIGFEHVNVTDPALQAEIDAYREELLALGEKSQDVSAFMTELQSSGLMEKNGTLMTKASTASMAAAESSAQVAGEKVQSGGLPTVREFLDQYRPSYEAAKSHGFQFTAVKAYEELFAVADRADDLLDMHIVLEEEGLLMKISSTALYDIAKISYDKLDPNEIFLRDQERLNMEIARTYDSHEDLYYRKDREVVYEAYKSVCRDLCVRGAVAALANSLLEYNQAKYLARTELDRYIGSFTATRLSARRCYEGLGEIFGLAWEDIVQVPRYKKMMLLIVNVGDYNNEGFRLNQCMDPQNLDWMKETLFEEVLSEKSIAELLLHKSNLLFHPTSIDEGSEIAAKAVAVGREKIKDLYWFR